MNIKTSEKTLHTSTQLLKKRFYAAIVGTVAVALCCFTPVLVIALGAVGLSAFTPYVDYVLLPGLAVLIIVTVLSYRSWKRTQQ
jgi:mercuric ion transport protein